MSLSPLDLKPLPDLLTAARTAMGAGALSEARSAAEAAWQRSQQAGTEPAILADAGVLLCQCLFRQGALAELADIAERVLPLVEAAEQWPLRAELLRRMTLAGCELGRFEMALRCANEVFELAQAHGDEHALSLAHSALGACFERMGDPWQAERLVTDGLRLARGLNDPYVLMVTLNNLCAITIGAFYLLRGSGEDEQAVAALQRAETYVRESRGLLGHFNDPLFQVFVEGNLGEVLLHRGHVDEAHAMLSDALAQAQARGYTSQAWRIRCSLGELLLCQGSPAEARQALTELLREIADQDARATLVRIHHALYQACRRLGLAEEALQQFERYEGLERRRAIKQLQAQSALFITRHEVEQTRREAERARQDAARERERAAVHAADALLDPLTGLGNRRQLALQLPVMLAAAAAASQPLCAAMVDIDHFKPINDRHGHTLGDQVLVVLAALLRAGTRASDLLVRLGGEEFLITLPDTTMERAAEVCERLRQRVADHDWEALAPGLAVTLSIGLVLAGSGAKADLLERADKAMYRAKAAGRNRLER